MINKNTSYVALLRGINVGGNRIVPMSDLKSVFEEMGFTDVSTYIQSGNVLFYYTGEQIESLTSKIEAGLLEKYTYKIPVVTLSRSHLHEIIMNAPEKFGSDPTTYRYDVMFLKSPLNSIEAMKNVKLKDGVDEVFSGKNVLYFSRLIEKVSQSYISRIVSLPIYQHMTIRNWNTTTKLFSLMKE